MQITNKSDLKEHETQFKIKIKLYVLLLLLLLVLILWGAILEPFFSTIALALALTTITYPFHEKIQSKLKNESLAAGVSVTLLAIILIVPTTFLMNQVVSEIGENIETVSLQIEEGTWRKKLNNIPALSSLWNWAEKSFNFKIDVKEYLKLALEKVPSLFTSSILSLVQLFLILFTAYFFYRDSSLVVSHIRDFLPLTLKESKEIILSVRDTIFATVYGTFLVAAIQGALGGIIFWCLGLPSPLLWGTIMAIVSIVPYLGAFVVWVPAAIFLALNDNWGKALILTIWGTIVIGLIDNLLYPLFVGKKLRLHTLLVFFFILGGVILFGFSGLILGPVILAIGIEVLKVCKKRLAPAA